MRLKGRTFSNVFQHVLKKCPQSIHERARHETECFAKRTSKTCIANPLAQFLSFAMMLRYSFGQAAEADLVERAVADALASGKRTGDIMTPGCEQVGTDGMTKAVLEAMDALAR